MLDLKVHINTTLGLNGVVIQRSILGKCTTVRWDELTTTEQNELNHLFQNIAIVYSNGDPSVITKRCTKCSRVLPLTLFYKRINSKGINVGSSVCKECHIKEVKARHLIHGRHSNNTPIGPKKQKKCTIPDKVVLINEDDVKVVPIEKNCKDCIRHDYCFPGEYNSESNFANECKKYDNGNKGN